MENVFDIRYEKNLVYIIPDSIGKENRRQSLYSSTAIILYIYYEDTVEIYCDYIFRVQSEIDVYIISSKAEVLEKIYRFANAIGKAGFTYILKENRGRDISALLVTSADIVRRYQYVCFLHDKKEHRKDTKEDTSLWIENLWGNLIGSPHHIDKVLKLFEENRNLGILAPPDPIGDYLCVWYTDGWHQSFDITRKLAMDLRIKADIDRNKPPIALGTALWFRSEALKKLYDIEWKYLDFDDEKLENTNYLSYGVERIFPYVAQDAGYDTGTIMTVSYAEKQTNYLQYATKKIFLEASFFFPFPNIKAIEFYKENTRRIISFAENHRNIYLYGAGQFGRFCFFLLSSKNLLPKGYIVSHNVHDLLAQGLPVVGIDQLESLSDIAIIITIYDKKDREKIVEKLEEKKFHNYIEFWI